MKIVLLRSMLALLAAILTSCSGSSTVPPPKVLQSFVYFGNSTDNSIEVFSANIGTGTLTTQQSVDMAAPPIALVVNADGKFLYSMDESYVYGFLVGNDGKLTANGAPVSAGNSCAALESVGNYLYAGCSGTIAAFKIDPVTGTLAATSGSPVAFPGATSRMGLDPTGHSLYVLSNSSPTDTILLSFSLDSSSGNISHGDGDWSFLGTPIPDLTFDHSGSHLFLIRNVLLYGPLSGYLDEYGTRANAALEPGPSVALSGSPDRLILHPTANVLYISYVGIPRILSYTYDTTGAVTRTQNWQSLPVNSGLIKVDASGTLLFATGPANQGLVVFQTDSAGKLVATGLNYLTGKHVTCITSLQR